MVPSEVDLPSHAILFPRPVLCAERRFWRMSFPMTQPEPEQRPGDSMATASAVLRDWLMGLKIF